jgi:E1A/CREB-binding protein
LFHFQLSEVFETEIDPVMQKLGYCCGRRYEFQPQVLCCYGKQLCTIPRDTGYWSFQNRHVLIFFLLNLAVFEFVFK